MKIRGKLRHNGRINEKSQSESDISEEASYHTMEANIIAEIKAVSLDLKQEFIEIMVQLGKRELVDFRGDVSQKLKSFISDLKEITNRVEETEQRVLDIELQDNLKAQLTDLEAHSCRNHIRIHNRVLSIQWCHHSLRTVGGYLFGA